jgi:hypothetical protein
MEVWAVFGLGVVMTVIGWLIVRVLNGIENRITEIKTEVSAIRGYIDVIKSDVHGRVTDLERRHEDKHVEFDRRLTKIEARCEIVHKEE